MARQALRVTLEAVPGTFDATATVLAILRMTNPVTDQPKPIHWEVRDAGGSGKRAQTGSAQNALDFKISTLMYPSQLKVFLTAAFTPSGTRGLPTYTVDQFKSLDVDGTKKYTRWLGCMVEKCTVRAVATGQGILFLVDQDWTAGSFSHSITSTDFGDPALNTYPSGQPMNLTQMATHLTVGSRTANFKEVMISVSNVIDKIYDENSNPTPQFYGARDVDWSANFRFTADSFRPAYEAVTAVGASFAVTDGTNTATWNLQSTNFYKSVDDELPIDRAFYQKVGGAAYLDVAGGTDCTLTITP
jgi:hypothetical protein